VAEGVRVARLDGERERGDDGLCALELVEQRLDPQQRGEARAQLDHLHRLGEEGVDARGEPGHPRVQLALRGQDHHRRQLVPRIGLHARAELAAADRSQEHVGQHQVRATTSSVSSASSAEAAISKR
jgi:hypothetical protein